MRISFMPGKLSVNRVSIRKWHLLLHAGVLALLNQQCEHIPRSLLRGGFKSST